MGRGRVENEDTYVIDEASGFFGICDGLSFGPAGEIAASVALEAAHRTVRHRPWVYERLAQGDGSLSHAMDLVDRAIELANQDVRQLSSEHAPYEGRACTATLLFVVGDQGALASVGDSRFYLSHRGTTRQLTIDHTPEEEARRLKPDGIEEGAGSRYVRRLSRLLGRNPTVYADVFPLAFEPGDRFLICSDGLSDLLGGESQLQSLLHAGDVSSVSHNLIRLADEAEGRDNATALVGSFED